jgi:hypothetical protein
MCPSILSAIQNIFQFRNSNLAAYSSTYLIRINAVGEQLEFYVKDAICGSFMLPMRQKERRYQEVFSLLGNQNNPPDAIIRGGDAFEIKKIRSLSASIALNSSPPKDRLHRDDPRITRACKSCEGGSWASKDLFYVVGSTGGKRIRSLFFVQGSCYCANREVYQRIANQLKDGIKEDMKILGIEGMSETAELGRINRVDPLGITNLRIRGMWMIENPLKVFSYIHRLNLKNEFTLSALMLRDKFQSCPSHERKLIESNNRIAARDVKIKNPNNPAENLDAKLISLGW